MKLSEAQIEKIQKADFANILKRLKAGKPLSSQERAIILAMREGKAGAPVRAKNQTEIASLLNVTARGFRKWQKLPGAPRAKANGEYDVAAWMEFKKANGLKPSDDHGDRESLTLRRLLAQCERLEMENSIRLGGLIACTEVQDIATKVFSSIRIDLQALENLAPQLAGLEPIEIAKLLREGIRDSLLHLSESSWQRHLKSLNPQA